MKRMGGYAGFAAPDEVLEDGALTAGEKRATLQHWLAVTSRRARSAAPAERAPLERLTIELAAAIEAVEIGPPPRHAWRRDEGEGRRKTG